MPNISAAIRNAVGEKTTEIRRLADQLEDILYQAGLGQRRGSHKDSRCADIKNICQDISDEVGLSS
jgi:hypothetical protein